METELRQFIEQARFCKASVLRVAEMLPADDAELDELVAEAVREGDQKVFVQVMVAALSRERRVDARHLARGTMMLPQYIWVGAFAVRVHGDLPEHLLAAITQTGLQRQCEAAALLVAAAWCEEHRDGKLPERLIPLARKLARNEKMPAEARAFLIALAVRTKDSGLQAVVKLLHPQIQPDKWQPVEEAAVKLAETFLTCSHNPILSLVTDKPSNVRATGTTMRRAVARIGRNEPCPCGSGRKYKNCCHDKDQERLHHSSDVAGVTREELYAQPETHLNQARLDQLGPFVLQRVDPTKIAPELLHDYFVRLCAFNLFDSAAAAFEKLGYTDALEGIWKSVIFMATRAGQKDSIRRLKKLRPDQVKAEEEIYTGAALLLADDNPAELVNLLEESALSVVMENTAEELEGFAYALMFSRFPSLGILVGRGTLPILPQKLVGRVFDQILETRDKLNLSPDDPFGDIVDERLAGQEDDGKKDSAELRKAQQNLNTKAQEVKQLKDALAHVQKEIARREAKRTVPAQTAQVSPQQTAEEPALKEMRQKVESLKSALKERHLERNDLRRDLQKAHSDLETLRQKAAPAPHEEAEAHDREEDLLLPPDAPAAHQPRVITFPKGFQQTLDALPRHVARAAIIMVGRLAGGEPAAYVGALRLKGTPDVMRQRIGSDFRLLFRLLPGQLQVIDLVNRKDLERRIKTLG